MTTRRSFLMGAAALAALAIVGSGNIASAAYPTPAPAPVLSELGLAAKDRLLRGTVKSISATSLVLTTADKGDLTITITDKTKYMLGHNRTATLADVKAGEKAAVLLAGQDTTNLVAGTILVEAGKAAKTEGVHGKLTSVQGTTLVVAGKNGNVTVKTDAQTRFLVPGKPNATITDLPLNEQVSAIGPQDTTDGFTARLVVVGTAEQLLKAGKDNGAAGKITAVNGTTLTLMGRKQGQNATVTFSDTTIFLKGRNQPASKDDLKVNTIIVAVGQRDTNGNVTAQVIWVK